MSKKIIFTTKDEYDITEYNELINQNKDER